MVEVEIVTPPHNHHCSELVVFGYDIDDAPTIDAVPVVHGRWEDDHMDYKCSSCGTAFQDEMFWIQGDFIAPNYCPNCGSKMDGGAEG